MITMKRTFINHMYIAYKELPRFYQTKPILNSATQEYLVPSKISKFGKKLVRRNQLHQFEFQRDAFDRVVIYTDGCCLNNNELQVSMRSSGIGVFFGANHPLNVSLPICDPLLTSGRSEILAAHAAVTIAKALKLEKVCVRSDSTYVINACTTWLPDWQVQGWSRKGGLTLKNIDLWKRLSRELRKVFTTFEKVNDSDKSLLEAHHLANQGARKN